MDSNNENITIDLTVDAPTSDDTFDNAMPKSIATTVLDNDGPGFTITQSAGNTSLLENASDSFTVVLNSIPTANVTLDLSSSNTLKGTVTPANITFTPANWNIPQTVTVNGVADLDLVDESIVVTVSVANTSASEYLPISSQTIPVSITDTTVAGFIVTQSGGNTTMTEGSSDSFTVMLTSKPSGTVVIDVNSNNTVKATNTPNILSFTPQNWNIPQIVVVNALQDADLVNENLNIDLSINQVGTIDNLFKPVSAQSVPVAILDDDIPGFTVTQTGGTTILSESGSDTVNVKLNIQPVANVTIQLSSADTSKATIAPAILTFTPVNWNIAQTATITGVQDPDTLDELVTQTFAIGAGSSSEYLSVANQTIQATVKDDDSPASSTPDLTTDSGSSGTDNITNVQYPTFSGTCTSGDLIKIYVDSVLHGQGYCSSGIYTISETLMMDDGNHNISSSATTPGRNESPQSIPLSMTLDTSKPVITMLGITPTLVVSNAVYTDSGAKAIDARDGVLTSQIVTVNNVNTGTDATYTVTYDVVDTAGNHADQVVRQVIVGNSVPSAPAIPIATGGLAQIVVNWTAPSANGSPITDYKVEYSLDGITWNTFAHPPSTITNLTITGLLDDTTYRVRVSAINSVGTGPVSPVATAKTDIVASNTPGLIITQTNGGLALAENTTDTYTVALKTQPSANVNVAISSSNPTKGSVSPSTLTFTTSNWNTPQTVTVSGVQDPDLKDETTTITNVVLSADLSYDSLAPQTFAATITDDDSAGFTLSQSSITAGENGGTATFTVVLDAQPATNVVLSTLSNSLVDATVSPALLTFTNSNWNTPQTVTVIGVDDNTISNDIATITVSVVDNSSDDKFDPLTDKTVAVTLTDDDTAGYTVTPSTLTMSENAGTGTIDIVLTKQPTTDVYIDVVATLTSDIHIDKSQLKFTNSNWNTIQHVAVTAVDDNIVRNDTATVTFQINDALSDNSYDPLADKTVNITLTDDDTPSFTLSKTSMQVAEGGGTGTFTIKLDKQPTADVVFDVISSSTSDGTISPSQITFTTLNWNQPKTITVTGVDDNKIGNDSANILVKVNQSATVDSFDNMPDKTVAVTFIDNEVAGVSIDKSSVAFAENTGDDTYKVVLNTQPSGDVTVTPNSSDVKITPVSLTFTSSNWNTPQTVTVSGVDNAIVDGTRNFVIVNKVTSSDTSYNNITALDVVATVTDNDNDADPSPITTQDIDGVSTTIEDSGPNNGDGDGDGVLDSLEGNVTTIPTADGNSFVTLVADGIGSCATLENVKVMHESDSGVDAPYDYPFGQVSFETHCSTSVTITEIWHGIDSIAGLGFRKYGPLVPGDSVKVFYDFPSTINTLTIGGKTTVAIKLSLTDGQKGDETGVDGLIRDPNGPVKKVAGAVDESSSSSSSMSATTTNNVNSKTTSSTNAINNIVNTGSSLWPYLVFAIMAFVGTVILLRRKEIKL